jgi:hypothetical protein
MIFPQDRLSRYGRMTRRFVCYVMILGIVIASALSASAVHAVAHSPAAISSALADADRPDGSGESSVPYSDHCGGCHFNAVMPQDLATSKPLVMTVVNVSRLTVLFPTYPPAPRKPPRA